MKWTEKQREAIELRGKNILVAAAAGSGKTAVLVERIKKLILEDGVSIDKMLIVTFTNAAASEMKEKIIKAIIKQIEENPKAADQLRQQLDIIYRANISTFHAFALEVIRRYFYVIDIDPAFSICDEAESELLKTQAVETIFEEFFEKGELRFFNFMDNYSQAKSFDKIKELIVELHEKLMSIPDSFEWLEKNVELLKQDENEFRNSDIYRSLIDEICFYLNNAEQLYNNSSYILDEGQCTLLSEKVANEAKQCREIAYIAKNEGFDAAFNVLKTMKSVRLVATKEEKEYYAEVKDIVAKLRKSASDIVKKVREEFLYCELAEHIEEIGLVYENAEVIKELIIRFAQIYGELKKKKGVVDFADIEHYALEILKNENVAAEYRNKFEYIFVDEYQDSNKIQDTLISYIKRDNNVFMVGDVKQSIYKFRLAEPELFMEKYALFSKKTDKNSKIDLNMNFRSKAGVIDFTNSLFRAAMDGYDDDASLYKGVNYTGELEYETEMHILCERTDNIETDTEVDDEISDLKLIEKEALVAVEIIRQHIGNPIYDTAIEGERKLQKRDIVILLRGIRNTGEIFRKALADHNIDAYVDNSNGYFDTVEIEVFLNLLKIIDNKHQDIPFISVLYSDLFSFSANDLASIRVFQRKGSYFDAFYNYAYDENNQDNELAEKCRNVISKIGEWKTFANGMPLADLFWKLMKETGYYTYCGALPGGIQRQANIRAMMDKAEEFSKKQAGGIYEFLNYIEKLKKRKIDVPQVKLVSENDDVVRIMTIHKSKGLEYPLVLVAGLGKKFNKTSQKSIVLHKDVGIGLQLSNYKEHWHKATLIQKLVTERQKREEAEEELRVLYVACTRAKDKLILLGSCKENIEELSLKEYQNPKDIYTAKNYLDVLIPALGGVDNVIFHSEEELANLTKDDIIDSKSIGEILNGEEIEREIYEEIERRFSYEYPFKEQLELKSKYSVSEICQRTQKNGNRKNIVLETPKFLMGKTNMTFSEIGTIYHNIFEKLDYYEAYLTLSEQGKNELINYLRHKILEMVDSEILLEEEAMEVDVLKIVKFIETDIFKRMAIAQTKNKLYKESPFVFRKQIDGENSLIQGIIDCWFEEDGEAVIVDYKTNRAKDVQDDIQRIVESYQAQIDLYAEAIEKIKGIKVKSRYLYLISLARFVEL